MDAQRLRNLTTGRLHTEIGCVYQDLEFITGMSGIMTHQLPNIIRAVEPWLKEHVKDQAFWDDKHRPDHGGEYLLEPMNESEQAEFMSRYEALPHPFAGENSPSDQSDDADMVDDLSVCVGCGCDDLHACIEPETGNGCHWLRRDGTGLGVCSECPECIEDWDKGPLP